MFLSLCYVALRWLLRLAALRVRSSDFKDLEIVVLRHELAIMRRRTRRRPVLTTIDRLFLTAASRFLPRARWCSFVITPATLGGLGDGAHMATSFARRSAPRRRMAWRSGSCAPFAGSASTGC